MSDGAVDQLALFRAPRAAPIMDTGSPCFDCGVDTVELREFYMVRDDVWNAAVPWNAAGGMVDFLCVGCLETRIGRPLARADFTDAPLNRLPGSSSRMRARLAGKGRPA